MEKTKTNKKSKTSLIVLLVAILLCIAVVLGMGGFTYAKYISSKTVETQKATVAKWGYVISADTSKLFGKNYLQNNIVTTANPAATDVDVQAASTNENNVVAPGTSGSMTFSITGSAEVRSAIKIVATTGTTVQLETGTGDSKTTAYEPIKWTLASKSSENDDYTTVSGWENGKTYSDMIDELGKLSVANIDPGDTTNIPLYYKLSWKWELETVKTEATTGDNATPATYYNLEDTILGACMAANTTKNTSADSAYTDVVGPKGETISIYYDSTNSNYNVTVTEVNATSSTTYTATTTVSLDLKISVEQIQGTGSSNQSSSETT